MGDDITKFEYSSIFDHFAHKLDALQKAESLYKEYLFLDWDVHIVKSLDNNFFYQFLFCEYNKQNKNSETTIGIYQFFVGWIK